MSGARGARGARGPGAVSSAASPDTAALGWNGRCFPARPAARARLGRRRQCPRRGASCPACRCVVAELGLHAVDLSSR
eukprot:6056083-Pyramimonas_sp.AAC.1